MATSRKDISLFDGTAIRWWADGAITAGNAVTAAYGAGGLIITAPSGASISLIAPNGIKLVNDLIFTANASIKGDGSNRTISIGTANDVVNLNIAGVTYNVGTTLSGDPTFSGNVTITGTLTINGSTTTVNSTTVTLDDPILTLGGDTSTVEVTKDRGIEFKWNGTTLTMTNFIGNGTSTVTGTVADTTGYATGDIITISGASGTEQTKLNGTWKITLVGGTTFSFVVGSTVTAGTYTTNLGTTVKSKNGFFGFDQSTGTFTFIPQSNNVSEVFSGTAGGLSVGAISSGAITSTGIVQGAGLKSVDESGGNALLLLRGTGGVGLLLDNNSDKLYIRRGQSGSTYHVTFDGTTSAALFIGTLTTKSNAHQAILVYPTSAPTSTNYAVQVTDTGGSGVAGFRWDGAIMAGGSVFIDASRNMSAIGTILPNATDTHDLGSATKLWNNIYSASLHTAIFAKSEISVFGGWQLIAPNAGKLKTVMNNTDVTSTSIDLGISGLTGIIVFKKTAQTEYMMVVSSVGTVYSLTRGYNSSSKYSWAVDDSFASFGTAGAGRIELFAESTAGGNDARISLFTLGAAGVEISGQYESYRTGNLAGVVTTNFGTLAGFGTYTNNLYAEGNANIAGNLTVANGRFFAGKMYANLTPWSDAGFEGLSANDITRWLSNSWGGIETLSFVATGDATAKTPFGDTKNIARSTLTSGTALYVDICPYAWRSASYKGSIPNSEKTNIFSLSFWIRASNASTPSVAVVGATWQTLTSFGTISVGTTWKKVSFYNWTFTHATDDAHILISSTGRSVNDYIEVTGCQLERGAFCTGYQKTDGTYYTTPPATTLNDYSMWSVNGGFGGTMQNPVVLLNAGGISIRDNGATSLSFVPAASEVAIGQSHYASLDGGAAGTRFGIFGYAGGAELFALRSTGTAQIAGWIFDNTQLYSNTSKNALNNTITLNAQSAYVSLRSADFSDGGLGGVEVVVGKDYTGVYGLIINQLSWEGESWTTPFSAVVDDTGIFSAQIAGWQFSTAYLYALAAGLPGGSPSNGIVLSSGGTANISIYEGTAKRIELGYLGTNIYGLVGYATNGTTKIFELSDTQQMLAGWKFDSTALYNVTTGSGLELLASGSTNISANGISIQYNAGAPQILIKESGVDSVYFVYEAAFRTPTQSPYTLVNSSFETYIVNQVYPNSYAGYTPAAGSAGWRYQTTGAGLEQVTLVNLTSDNTGPYSGSTMLMTVLDSDNANSTVTIESDYIDIGAGNLNKIHSANIRVYLPSIDNFHIGTCSISVEQTNNAFTWETLSYLGGTASTRIWDLWAASFTPTKQYIRIKISVAVVAWFFGQFSWYFDAVGISRETGFTSVSNKGFYFYDSPSNYIKLGKGIFEINSSSVSNFTGGIVTSNLSATNIISSGVGYFPTVNVSGQLETSKIISDIPATPAVFTAYWAAANATGYNDGTGIDIPIGYSLYYAIVYQTISGTAVGRVTTAATLGTSVINGAYKYIVIGDLPTTANPNITHKIYRAITNTGLPTTSSVVWVYCGNKSYDTSTFVDNRKTAGAPSAVAINTATNIGLAFYSRDTANTQSLALSLTSSSITVSAATSFSSTVTLSSSNCALNLTGSTSRYISMTNSGLGAPTYNAISAGTKLILYATNGASYADYALGVNTGILWFGTPDTTDGFAWYSKTTKTMSLDGSGNLITTGNITANGTPSDRELKSNIDTISGLEAISTIRRFNPVRFDWNDKSSHWTLLGSNSNRADYGFVAQEMMDILPNIVTKSGDYLGIKYDRIFPFITSAIQYIDNELEVTKKLVQELRSEISKLKQTAHTHGA